MVSDHSDRNETSCRHIGYSFRIAARVPLYAPSHRQEDTYHSFCYTIRGALDGMRIALRAHHEGSILMIHHTMSKLSYHRAFQVKFFYHLDLTRIMEAAYLVSLSAWTMTSCLMPYHYKLSIFSKSLNCTFLYIFVQMFV